MRYLKLIPALLLGIAFGFLLQRAGVTRYETIMGQLFLTDFTVLKVMLSAVLVGSVGFRLLRMLGRVEPRRKGGSVGSSVIGGLVFGVGFGLLGYCPGTLAGAAGQGSLDALIGGGAGMLLGSWLYTLAASPLRRAAEGFIPLGESTLYERLGQPPWRVVGALWLLIPAFFGLLEWIGV
ncbi:DUF6691 family protein [Desulfohalovibrio reitneri]|uniref:DUF6691 family protein n=1 Tax=Desulfohalovibrio reitneri TaxID=1307759 RepID=UPI00055905BA|nr:DUF6691 family protein [Desulfohalovibrio reitneri]